SEESTSADPGATRDTESETAWSLRLLWDHREQSSPGEPAVRGDGDLAEVAQPTFVGWVLLVAASRATARVFCSAAARRSPLGVPSGSDTVTRRAGCLNGARPDLWEAVGETPPP